MTETFKTILWATDFSEEAQQALLYANLFAKVFNAKLTACHVTHDFSPALYEVAGAARVDLARKVGQMKDEARGKIESLAKAKGITFKKIVIKEGSVSKKIIQTSEEEKADLIVMGKRGQSPSEKILLGGVTNHVLRSSEVPILVVPQKKGAPAIKKILVPTDFSKQEEIERDFAWKLAKGFDASLHLIYVLEILGEDSRIVDDMFESVLKRLKAREKREKEDIEIIEKVTRAARAWEGIVEYAESQKLDLIVMSTFVHNIARFFLGSTTEKVISHSAVPVFAIPPFEKGVQLKI